MKYPDGSLKSRNAIVIGIALVAFVSAPWSGLAATTLTSVNIVNNSSRDIRNVYYSHVGADDWSNDLLGDGAVTAGASYTLESVPCDGQQIKVIAEDQDGCFLSLVISCGQSSTWTITNDTARDCGY